jgi:hypothetical protein
MAFTGWLFDEGMQATLEEYQRNLGLKGEDLRDLVFQPGKCPYKAISSVFLLRVSTD